MENNTFDIFFNHCAADTYLVQYLSQPLRDRGYSTFDRSVDEYPTRKIDVVSEDDALAESLLVINVITAEAMTDASVQDLAARAVSTKKPMMNINFTDQPLPDNLKPYPEIKGSAEDIPAVVKQLERDLKEIDLPKK